jgi:hypothetical protein
VTPGTQRARPGGRRRRRRPRAGQMQQDGARVRSTRGLCHRNHGQRSEAAERRGASTAKDQGLRSTAPITSRGRHRARANVA